MVRFPVEGGVSDRAAQRTLAGVAEVVSELAGCSDVADSLARAKAALDEDLHAYVSCDLTQVDQQLAKIGEVVIDGGSSLRYRELLREIEEAKRPIGHLVGEAPAEGAPSVLEEELNGLIGERKEDEALRAILASLSTRLGAVFLVVFPVRRHGHSVTGKTMKREQEAGRGGLHFGPGY